MKTPTAMDMTLKLLLCAALLGLGLGTAGPAFAEGLIHELSIGVLAHDVPDLWSGFRKEPSSADINVEAKLSPSMAAFFGTMRPAIGATISTEGHTSHAYIDARVTNDLSDRLFIGWGVGAAVHDGNTGPHDPQRKALGSQLLFHIPFEIGFRLDGRSSVSAYFEHTSNANTQRYNEGMDRLGVRYGYRF
jgi:hypothetical protein